MILPVLCFVKMYYSMSGFILMEEYIMLEDLTLRKGLQLAVKTEQLGAQFYERMAARFSTDKEVSDVFTQLAKDEKVHEAQFNAIMKTVPPDEPGSGGYEIDQYVRAVAVSEFFRIEEFKKIDNVKTRDDALGAALAFEKSTLLYYHALRESLGDSPSLNAIINAERSHITSLTRILVTSAKFRGIRDNW
jgi:rubrerythrin